MIPESKQKKGSAQVTASIIGMNFSTVIIGCHDGGVGDQVRSSEGKENDHLGIVGGGVLGVGMTRELQESNHKSSLKSFWWSGWLR